MSFNAVEYTVLTLRYQYRTRSAGGRYAQDGVELQVLEGDKDEEQRYFRDKEDLKGRQRLVLPQQSGSGF